MPKASVKRLIDNRKDKLIEFVLDIEKYPEFIPFCDNSKVYERTDKGDTINIIADLTIGKGPFKDTFKSDVKLNKKDDHIHVVTSILFIAIISEFKLLAHLIRDLIVKRHVSVTVHVIIIHATISILVIIIHFHHYLGILHSSTAHV